VKPLLFSKLSQLWRRLLFYLRRDRFDRELEEEMRFHLEMKARENAEWYEWRRHNTVFTDIAASQPENVTFSGDGEPEELPGRKVTANLWTVLGVKPLLGRVFTEDEDTRGMRVVLRNE
jgi:hypothetical protein